MKKIKWMLGAVLLCVFSQNASSQSFKDILSGVAKTVVGDKATTAQSILGTWVYSSPDCQFESDNLLAKAGGEAAAKKVESQLENVYRKIGMAPFTYVFNADGTYSSTVKGKTTTGTYTFDSEAKTITMKTRLGVSMMVHVAVTGSSMSLLFKADKLMNGLKTMTNLASKVNSNASLFNSLAGNYEGMMLGFELKKQ